jgi:hypothetical protein
LERLHARDGLVEFVNILFMIRTLKSVVQVRAVRQDKATGDLSKIRGEEVVLRTVHFGGIQNIEEHLKEIEKLGNVACIFANIGVVWAKHGLWTSESLSVDDNLRRGQWLVFGVCPESTKSTPLVHQTTNASDDEQTQGSLEKLARTISYGPKQTDIENGHGIRLCVPVNVIR